MNLKQKIIQEIDQTPEFLLSEVFDFLQFIKTKYSQETLETTLLSEAFLAQNWLKPEEDEAWQDL